MIEQAKKILPQGMTSYDVLKCAAVLIMVVDHVGYYFFEDELWWRMVGRLCVPIWMFLIGYARSRDMGPAMWIWMVVLALGNVVAGMYVFPLNILATILMIRIIMDPLMERMLRSKQIFWSLNTVLLALTVPTMMLTEYGTHAIILAILGYLVRHQQDGDPRVSKDLVTSHMMFAVVTFLAMQYLMFTFTQPQMMVLCVGTIAVNFALLCFKPGTISGTTEGAGAALSWPVRMIGRHTLLIYGVHLLAFKALGVMLLPEKFQFLQWTWFIP